MSKVLVTGATGFIGRALVRRLLDNSCEVTALSSENGDIANPETFRRYLNTGLERVFHLGGLTYVPDSWDDPLRFYRINVLGTANVAEFCRLSQVPLTFVSAYIYGQPTALPIDERSSAKPNNPYAFSKYLAENVCEFYARTFGVPTIVIRPFNVYGIGQNPRFLIPSIIDQVLRKSEIVVQDLKPRRDYIYIDDLVDAITRAPGCGDIYRIYNVGGGLSLSVKEIIDVIQSEAKTAKPVFSTEVTRQNEIDDVVADISKMQSELGWHPQTSFADGIRKILLAQAS